MSTMIRYKEIAFVAYPVTRMARARKFYEKVLGLKSNGFARGRNPQFVEYDIGPGTLAIGSSPLWKPSRNGPTVALEVEDFDAAVAHLRKRRVKFVLGPAEAPKCRMVAIRDPDGNKVTLHQRKS
jgi:catechol 2,3-dioxygenase-like lactoylglutathione lyase family enzyme